MWSECGLILNTSWVCSHLFLQVSTCDHISQDTGMFSYTRCKQGRRVTVDLNSGSSAWPRLSKHRRLVSDAIMRTEAFVVREVVITLPLWDDWEPVGLPSLLQRNRTGFCCTCSASGSIPGLSVHGKPFRKQSVCSSADTLAVMLTRLVFYKRPVSYLCSGPCLMKMPRVNENSLLSRRESGEEEKADETGGQIQWTVRTAVGGQRQEVRCSETE